MTTGRSSAQARATRREAVERPVGSEERHTGFRASAVGFVLMTALVAVAATGVFILLDPRAQAFWGAKFGELLAVVRSVLGR